MSLDRPSSPGKTSSNLYIVSFGRKFITYLIHLIGAMCPKFDVSPNRRSSFGLGLTLFADLLLKIGF